ncbi:MerR family transcriptional regulator [Longimonas halophila]|uniref:MerR family transcriptional regulator n=1 Tax=Longimonas halophila TaxID=1469170 RepID=A0A2H3NQ11_9BACT|nr:MerR family transcriptional regulator [Longimonas halophila]PEN09162.1 MerR family transcriptional regulator [Longimonas halophila]
MDTESDPENVLMDWALLDRLVVGIGEVAEITGVSKRKLRYWQEKGVIEPVDDAEGATRRFDYLNIKKVLLVKELVDEGYRLDAAQEKVEERMRTLSEAFSKLAK